MMTYREQHNRRTSLVFLIALGLHVPIFLMIGAATGKPAWVTVLLSALFLAGPVALYVAGVTSSLLPCVVSFTGIAFSGLLIHLAGGMIEMHFHIFVMMAAFISFGLGSPIVVGLATTAVHHLAFFFLLPRSVFNYEASIWIVLLHAGFVIIETVPALFIARRFQKLIDSQDSTMGELSSITDRVSQSVSELHDAGQTLSSSSSGTAASLQETGAALEQINSMVQLSSSNAQQVADLSRTSNEFATKGEAEVSSLVGAMQGMAQFSRRIEEITAVIDDLAFQTNLLALNAAVEAARAGDQGNGFAVVAEAVRELAQRSGVAAKDISALIAQSRQLVESGVGATKRSGEALQKIVHSVKKVAQLNQEIASSSREQASGIQNMMRGVSTLDSAAQSTAHTSERFTLSADALAQESARMKDLLGDLQADMA
jgi:methyl-accepting chemotaxis protein